MFFPKVVVFVTIEFFSVHQMLFPEFICSMHIEVILCMWGRKGFSMGYVMILKLYIQTRRIDGNKR